MNEKAPEQPNCSNGWEKRQDFKMIQTDYDAGRAAFLAGKDDFDDHPTRESGSDKARSWQHGWLEVRDANTKR